jgi:hypothetical protein
MNHVSLTSCEIINLLEPLLELKRAFGPRTGPAVGSWAAVQDVLFHGARFECHGHGDSYSDIWIDNHLKCGRRSDGSGPAFRRSPSRRAAGQLSDPEAGPGHVLQQRGPAIQLSRSQFSAGPGSRQQRRQLPAPAVALNTEWRPALADTVAGQSRSWSVRWGLMTRPGMLVQCGARRRGRGRRRSLRHGATAALAAPVMPRPRQAAAT